MIMILLYFFHRGIAKAYLDILTVISKGFSKDRKSADMFCTVFHSEAEADITAAVEVKIIDFDIRYFQSVDICSIFIYDKLF